MKRILESINDKSIEIRYNEDEYDIDIISSYALAVIIKKHNDGTEETYFTFDLDVERKIIQIANHCGFYTVSNNGTINFYQACDTHLNLEQQFKNITDIQLIKAGTFILYDDKGYAYIYNSFKNQILDEYLVDNIYIDKEIMDYIGPKYHSTVLIKGNTKRVIRVDRTKK